MKLLHVSLLFFFIFYKFVHCDFPESHGCYSVVGSPPSDSCVDDLVKIKSGALYSDTNITKANSTEAKTTTDDILAVVSVSHPPNEHIQANLLKKFKERKEVSQFLNGTNFSLCWKHFISFYNFDQLDTTFSNSFDETVSLNRHMALFIMITYVADQIYLHALDLYLGATDGLNKLIYMVQDGNINMAPALLFFTGLKIASYYQSFLKNLQPFPLKDEDKIFTDALLSDFKKGGHSVFDKFKQAFFLENLEPFTEEYQKFFHLRFHILPETTSSSSSLSEELIKNEMDNRVKYLRQYFGLLTTYAFRLINILFLAEDNEGFNFIQAKITNITSVISSLPLSLNVPYADFLNFSKYVNEKVDAGAVTYVELCSEVFPKNVINNLTTVFINIKELALRNSTNDTVIRVNVVPAPPDSLDLIHPFQIVSPVGRTFQEIISVVVVIYGVYVVVLIFQLVCNIYYDRYDRQVLPLYETEKPDPFANDADKVLQHLNAWIFLSVMAHYLIYLYFR